MRATATAETKTKQSKKVLLEFKERELKTAQVQFEKKQDVRKQLYIQLEKLIDTPINQSEDVEADPLFYYYEWLLVKHHSSNTMKLKAPKLVELMEIDLSDFKKAIAEFKAVPDIKKPTKKDFEVYAETPEELARLKLANDIIAVADRYNQAHPTPDGLDLKGFYPVVEFKGGKYVPDNYYIKASSRYKNILK